MTHFATTLDATSVLPGRTTQPASDEHVGVRGWLLVFCISLTVISPLANGIVLYQLWALVIRSLDPASDFVNAVAITTAVSLGVTWFAIRSGVGLLRRRVGAVAAARRYLVGYLCSACAIAFLWLAVTEPIIGFAAAAGAQLRDLGRACFYVLIWYSYLTTSKRVRATYADARDDT